MGGYAEGREREDGIRAWGGYRRREGSDGAVWEYHRKTGVIFGGEGKGAWRNIQRGVEKEFVATVIKVSGFVGEIF